MAVDPQYKYHSLGGMQPSYRTPAQPPQVGGMNPDFLPPPGGPGVLSDPVEMPNPFAWEQDAPVTHTFRNPGGSDLDADPDRFGFQTTYMDDPYWQWGGENPQRGDWEEQGKLYRPMQELLFSTAANKMQRYGATQPWFQEVAGQGIGGLRDATGQMADATLGLQRQSTAAAQMAATNERDYANLYGDMMGRGVGQGQVDMLASGWGRDQRWDVAQRLQGRLDNNQNIETMQQIAGKGGPQFGSMWPNIQARGAQQGQVGGYGAGVPDSMGGLQDQLAGSAQGLLQQPHGLDPATQQNIMRGVRDTASQSREAGIERAAASMGNRGLGTRGSMGAQNVMNAYQQEGQQVAGAQRQLQTQAALARPGEIQAAMGAAGGALGQSQQYGLGQTGQLMQQQQAAAANQQGWNQFVGNQLMQERGQNINATYQNQGQQIAAAQGAEQLQQSGLGQYQQLGQDWGQFDLQQQLANQGGQQQWNALMAQTGAQQAQTDLSRRQQTGQFMELGNQGGAAYFDAVRNQMPLWQSMANFGLQDPLGQEQQSIQLLSQLGEQDLAAYAAKKGNEFQRSSLPNDWDRAAMMMGAVGGLRSSVGSFSGPSQQPMYYPPPQQQRY